MKLGDFTGMRGIPTQDMAMWETMGPIADRSAERLGASDVAIVEFRRLMVDAVRRHANGEPAIGDAWPSSAVRHATIVRRHRAQGHATGRRSARSCERQRSLRRRPAPHG